MTDVFERISAQLATAEANLQQKRLAAPPPNERREADHRLLPPPQRAKPRTARGQSRARRHHVTRWATLGAAAGAVVAAVLVFVLVVGTTGSGPASAFAGWTAKPSRPTKNQIQASEFACEQPESPTLTDTRGPYSLLLFAQPGQPIYLCASFPSATGQAVSIGSSATAGTIGNAVAANSIAIANHGLRTDRANRSAYSILYGYLGADVTAITLVLNDGTQVQPTTQNGLFAAWWPGTQGVQTANITTTTGTATQTLNIPTVTLPPGLFTTTPAESSTASNTTTTLTPSD